MSVGFSDAERKYLILADRVDEVLSGIRDLKVGGLDGSTPEQRRICVEEARVFRGLVRSLQRQMRELKPEYLRQRPGRFSKDLDRETE